MLWNWLYSKWKRYISWWGGISNKGNAELVNDNLKRWGHRLLLSRQRVDSESKADGGSEFI